MKGFVLFFFVAVPIIGLLTTVTYLGAGRFCYHYPGNATLTGWIFARPLERVDEIYLDLSDSLNRQMTGPVNNIKPFLFLVLVLVIPARALLYALALYTAAWETTFHGLMELASFLLQCQ